MVPSLLIDISKIDMDNVIVDSEGIEKVNPHRGHMRMLDGIVYTNDESTEGIGVKYVREDEFWVPGHIPGRPIFPGVLMMEAAAQLCSYVTLTKIEKAFMGFAALDKGKFRGQVVPGDTLYILAKEIDFRPRRSISMCQGICNGNMVFEAQITGMPM